MCDGLTYPDYAYVPGRTPRHAEGFLDYLRASVQPGASVQELQQSPAWTAGLCFIEHGYYWEAHEVLEPVWMVLPHGSPEREMAQALIQYANALLKREMQRPRAVLRLCKMIQGQLVRIGRHEVMGQSPVILRNRVHDLECQIQNHMYYSANKLG